MRGVNEDASPSFSLGDSNEDSGYDSVDVDAGYSDEELDIIESRMPGRGFIRENRANG